VERGHARARLLGPVRSGGAGEGPSGVDLLAPGGVGPGAVLAGGPDAGGQAPAPMLPVLVPLLCRDGELDLSDDEAVLLASMSAATIDRRLTGAKVLAGFRGVSHTKPGVPAEDPDPHPDLVGVGRRRPRLRRDRPGRPRGGQLLREFCFTLTMTDIATGWTINRSVPNKSAIRVAEAIEHGCRQFPSPSSGSTRTMAANSSTPTCSSGAPPAASPSPGPVRATRTTAVTWSRRTGPMCESWSATCASTPKPNWWRSTGSGPGAELHQPAAHPAEAHQPHPGGGQGHQAPRQRPEPLSAPGGHREPHPGQAGRPHQSPQRPPSDPPPGRDRPAHHQLQRLALAKTGPLPRTVNRAFTH